MHGFFYKGRPYRSIRAACKALDVHYSKARRIYRTYRRAHDEPALALDWALNGIPPNEPHTFMAARDARLTADRAARCRERVIERILNS